MEVTKYIQQQFDKKDLLPLGPRNLINSLAALYHENSKSSRFSLYTELEKIMTFTDPFILRRSANPFKTYVDRQKFYLNSEIELPNESFLDVLKNRRSKREYDSQYILTKNDISALCYLSYGVVHWEPIIGDNRKGCFGYRNIPSGGALYPMELYFISFKSYLPQGLYHYRPDINCLELVKEGEFISLLNECILASPKVDFMSCSGIFLTTSIIERVIIKYGERGYRFMMMEAGAVNALLTFVASSLNLATCSIGGYYDDEVNDFLEIDGAFETVNNILIVGGDKP